MLLCPKSPPDLVCGVVAREFAERESSPSGEAAGMDLNTSLEIEGVLFVGFGLAVCPRVGFPAIASFELAA